MAKKQSIAEQVKADEAALKAMTTANELRQWAVSKGMDNRAAFPRFKNALLDIGVDYAAIRAGRTAERREELDTAITHRVTLYSDAKASQDRYAITDADGSPLWYGRFFDSDRDYDGEQSSGELAAAAKAIWLASKVAEAIGSTAIRLDLYVDAQWLLYQDGPKQKGFALTRAANRLNVDLHLHWIPGKENPADEWTTDSGYKKWQDNDLKALAVPVTGDESEEEVEEVLEEVPVQDDKAIAIKLAMAKAMAARARALALTNESETIAAVQNATKQGVMDAMKQLRETCLSWANENKDRFGDIDSIVEQMNLMNEFGDYAQNQAEKIAIKFEDLGAENLSEVVNIDSVSVQSGSNYLRVSLTTRAIEDLIDRNEVSDSMEMWGEDDWEIRISNHEDYHLPAMGIREQVRYKW